MFLKQSLTTAFSLTIFAFTTIYGAQDFEKNIYQAAKPTISSSKNENGEVLLTREVFTKTYLKNTDKTEMVIDFETVTASMAPAFLQLAALDTPNIKILTLAQCRLQDFSSLYAFKHLEHLTLLNWKTISMKDADYLHLKSLSLHGGQISKKMMELLPKTLSSLTINKCKIDDDALLPKLPNLKTITMIDVDSLACMKTMTTLTRLDIFSYPSPDFSVFNTLPSLTYLTLYQCPNLKTEALEKLNNPTKVFINGHPNITKEKGAELMQSMAKGSKILVDVDLF